MSDLNHTLVRSYTAVVRVSGRGVISNFRRRNPGWRLHVMIGRGKHKFWLLLQLRRTASQPWSICLSARFWVGGRSTCTGGWPKPTFVWNASVAHPCVPLSGCAAPLASVAGAVSLSPTVRSTAQGTCSRPYHAYPRIRPSPRGHRYVLARACCGLQISCRQSVAALTQPPHRCNGRHRSCAGSQFHYYRRFGVPATSRKDFKRPVVGAAAGYH